MLYKYHLSFTHYSLDSELAFTAKSDREAVDTALKTLSEHEGVTDYELVCVGRVIKFKYQLKVT